jgi:N-acetylmuramic acid 6-phosphate etherase
MVRKSKAKEGVEDSEEAGMNDLKALDMNSANDVALGIAASGSTPYVLGALKYAHKLGCLTVGIACTSPSAMSELTDGADAVVAQHMIAPVVGPEVITGSTRMKAGTATKLASMAPSIG